MGNGIFANVIVDIAHEKVDKPFQYKIPEHLLGILEVGQAVEIPFGKGDTLRKGYVVDISDVPEFPVEKMKEISGIAVGDVAVEDTMIKLAYFIKQRYGSTMYTALKTVLPARQKKKNLEKREILRKLPVEEIRELRYESARKHHTSKARLLEELEKEEMLPEDLLKQKLHINPTTIKTLEKQGVIDIKTISFYRNPVKVDAQMEAGKALNEEQQHVFSSIQKDMSYGLHKTYLIRGVTGSGKTEVYMALIESCIAAGKQAIMLIPEIALTYQTVMRFYKRFGDRVSVMNSTLSAGEKYDQCMRAKNGDIDIIIGPRSALFTPFPKVGLVIIDEEHESSYKSETMPKYHAREVAEELCKLHGASLVLGSATPSLDSYYRATHGEYTLFTMEKRATGGMLPTVTIADMREELRSGNRSAFSRVLQEKIADRLEKGQQVMLFLNRRGYAGFVSCRSCGEAMKCPHCDVALSQHVGGKLMCHYCGYEAPMPKMCPKCGSKYIMGFRAGTQQVEQKLHEMYPKARILRMDGDTTKTKDSYDQILSAFAGKEADILLGTQMIVKGHDFPDVTLVGALMADMSLYAGDYRAAERTFDLLTQAAGRAGRGTTPGEVVIQTYKPDHYAIVHAADQNYLSFYEEEALYRELGHYPPAGHMMAVLLMDYDEKEVEEKADRLAEVASKGKVAILGPGEASLSKLQDMYRRVFYIKAYELPEILQAKDRMEAYWNVEENRGNCQVSFDLDPLQSY